MLQDALALQEKGQLGEAAALYLKILAQNPQDADALHLLGMIELEKGNRLAALGLIERALAIHPKHPILFNNRGVALQELKRFDDALASCDCALAIRPDFAEALNNRGNALQGLKRFDSALASYARALAVKPDYFEALNNRGDVLRKLNRFDSALSSYDRALAVKSDYAAALHNRAATLQDLKRFDEALASYDRALAIKPDDTIIFGQRLFCRMRACNWRGIAADFDRLVQSIALDNRASPPFLVVATSLSAALQRKNSEIFTQERHPGSAVLPPCKGRYEHDRIRLGYFSADFRDHATAYLMAELFERHDRAKFELIAFSFGPPTRDAMRTRLEKSFDRFIEAGALSDKDVALLARSLEIDIAIDL